MKRHSTILSALALLAALSSAAIWAVEQPRPATEPVPPASEPPQPMVAVAEQPALGTAPPLFTFRVPVRLEAIIEGTRVEVRCDVRHDGTTLAVGTQEVPLGPRGTYGGFVTVATRPLRGVSDLSRANRYHCWLILRTASEGHAACPASAPDCPVYARIKPGAPSRTGIDAMLP